MHALQTVLLRLQLNKVGNPIPCVQSSILVRLIADLQQAVHLLLADTYTPCNLRQPLVRIIPCLVHHARIEEVFLLVEQLLAEIVKLVRLDFEHSEACLVHEYGGRVPGLDLLAEDGDDAVRVLLKERLA